MRSKIEKGKEKEKDKEKSKEKAVPKNKEKKSKKEKPEKGKKTPPSPSPATTVQGRDPQFQQSLHQKLMAAVALRRQEEHRNECTDRG